MALTEKQVNEQREKYLLDMANILTTALPEQLEFMYNETKRRCKTQTQALVYPKLARVIEQVAESRSMTITEIDGKFRFTEDSK